MSTTHGAYTVGVARLSRQSGLVYDGGGLPASLTAVYTALLACGTLGTPSTISGLPAVNAAHSTLTALRAQGYRFDCVTNNVAGYDKWEISVEYSPRVADSSGDWGTSRLVAASWDTHDWEQELTYDPVNNREFLTASGGAFDSAPMIPKAGRVVSFTRLQSESPASAVALTGTVNSAAVTCLGFTFAARTGKVRVSGRDTLATSGLRYELTVAIHERTNVVKLAGGENSEDIGWDVAILEADYYYLDGSTPAVRVRFMEEEEETGEPRPSATPQLLTGIGADGRGGNPYFRRWNTALGDAWTALRLPS